jgi:hypothetical protein
MSNVIPSHDAGSHNQPPLDGDALVCVKCNGEPAKPAVAFINTGEDWTKHRQEVVTIECELCGGSGKISLAVASRYHEGKQHREDRVARAEMLFHAAQRLGVSSAELSAYEHGYRDLPNRPA